jgi:hypothetical protein
MCALLNLVAFFNDDDGNGILDFFEGDDILSSTITLIYLPLFLLAPFYGYFKIYKTRDNLHALKDDELMDVYIDGVKLKSLGQAMYNIFFMIRRLLSMIVLIYWHKLPYFELTILIVLSMSNMVYMIHFKPLVEGNL